VIGEPVFFRPTRPTTILSDQDGKVEDPRRPESQEACPGALIQPNSSTEGVWAGPRPPDFGLSELGGFFVLPRLYSPESFHRRRGAADADLYKAAEKKAPAMPIPHAGEAFPVSC